MTYYHTTDEIPTSIDTLARELADEGMGMALDNAGDMMGVDDTDHLAVHWRGYIGCAVEQLLDDGIPGGVHLPRVLEDILYDALCERACAVAPELAAGYNLTLYDAIETDE